MSIFDGEPRLFLTEKGATIKFVGGQPIMDAGLENYVLLALFTKPGWWGNALFDDPNEELGSDFEEANLLPITSANFAKVEEAGKRALASMENTNLAESIEVETTNPSGYIRQTSIKITQPGGTIRELLVIKNGLNWLFQAGDPAHLKVA